MKLSTVLLTLLFSVPTFSSELTLKNIFATKDLTNPEATLQFPVAGKYFMGEFFPEYMKVSVSENCRDSIVKYQKALYCRVSETEGILIATMSDVDDVTDNMGYSGLGIYTLSFSDAVSLVESPNGQLVLEIDTL